MRKVTRDINEDVRDHVRALVDTEAFRQSSRERKKVEMRFAHMKRIFKLDRLRLRGLSGAKDEVLLTATAQNLRRLAKLVCRPPPAPMFAWRRHQDGRDADALDARIAPAQPGRPVRTTSQPMQTNAFCNRITVEPDVTDSAAPSPLMTLAV